MTTIINIKFNEVIRLFCENLKRMFIQKLRKRNVDVKLSVDVRSWLCELYHGDITSKKLDLPMGKSYKFELILAA